MSATCTLCGRRKATRIVQMFDRNSDLCAAGLAAQMGQVVMAQIECLQISLALAHARIYQMEAAHGYKGEVLDWESRMGYTPGHEKETGGKEGEL